MSDDEGMLLTRIVIERRIGDDGEDAVFSQMQDANRETPGLVEILGLLEMTKDTAIRCAMADGEDDD